MALSLSEIVQDLRLQMAHKGGATLSSLNLAFSVNDLEKTGIFNFEDFVEILAKCGLFARRQELTKLYRYFDAAGDEQLNYREFIRALQGEVNARRGGIINACWVSIAGENDAVSVQDLMDCYQSAAHPLVKSGEKTEGQAQNELYRALVNAGTTMGDTVSKDAFSDYYCAVSASNPYDDDLFVKSMEQQWGVFEDPRGSKVPAALVKKIRNVIRESVRQRAKHVGQEMEGLRLAFKFFDLSDDGTVSFQGFMSALGRFGVVLTEEVAAGVFADFDDRGKINYSEFVAACFQGDAIAPAYSGLCTAVRQGAKITAVLVLGTPVSACGTFCARLARELGVVNLNADECVEAEAQNPRSPFAQTLAQLAAKGKAVPADVKVAIVENMVLQYKAAGKQCVVIQALPNDEDELIVWQQQARVNGIETKAAVLLDLPESTMLARLAVRDPKGVRAISLRNTYERDVLPVIGKLENLGLMNIINADDTDSNVYDQLNDIVAALL